MKTSLHIDSLRFFYPHGGEVLRGITLRIVCGERVALMGVNGAGKSTLMLHTNGLLMPKSGHVEIEGIELTKRNLRRIRQRVGMLFQNSDDQLFMPTVGDDVAFGVRNMGLEESEVERRTVAALNAVGALHLRNRTPYELSGGEKRRAALATVLAMEPSILVMDEPSSGLDPRARHEIISLLETLPQTQLIATHDTDLAARLCPRTVILDGGQIVADGETAAILSDRPLLVRCGLAAPDDLPQP